MASKAHPVHVVSCMDSFNEELLLAKEWLVKVDAHTSTPYLIKFHSSPGDLTCAIMITDTKRTWAEALSTKQLARRWRDCNNRICSPPLDDEQEDAWRTRTLDLLSNAHSLGGMVDLSFEVVESKFGDFAFQLESSAFKWRWDTIFVGHKASADILSKHLIMPLISMNHLAFSSSDAVADLPPTDLEMAIDKVARTARRTVDTHVKNALSKPRLATSIRRITAVFNFISNPPNVATRVDAPSLLPPPEPTPRIHHAQHPQSTHAPEPADRLHPINAKRDSDALPRRPSRISQAADSGSATEPEDDDDLVVQPSTARLIPGSSIASADQPADSDAHMRSPTPPREAPPRPGGDARSRSVTKAPLASDTDSSPVRPVKKKAKPRATSSDEDSEEERKRVTAQMRSGSGGPGRGVRQPIKRGGRRF